MCRRFFILLSLALVLLSCARKDPAVESLVGSEPQRLSFGEPAQVLESFEQKMRMCWFAGPSSTLGAYRYETGDSPAQNAEAGAGFRLIKVLALDTGMETFEIQFHKYNDNTLIVTRNIALPPDLLVKVKRDIQLWALNGGECNGP